MIIIFSGHIARTGLGGSAWANMQYLGGLLDLGHEVFYMEDTGENAWTYDWRSHESTTSLDFPAHYLASCLNALGLAGRWIYRSAGRDAGMDLREFLDVCDRADLLIFRAVPVSPWRQEYDRPRRRAFIDVDPGFTQIALAQGMGNLPETVDRCERLFSIGQRIGRPGCIVPSDTGHWLTTVPPVSLRHWPVASGPPATHFTSLVRWRGFRDASYRGETYGQKDREFPAFLDLPQRSGQRFLLGHLGGDEKLLERHGWELVPGWVASATPASFREFISGSRGEISIAKHGYVKMQCGWFSDRSVCYLASGRPVVAEDTGLGDWLPTGMGVVTFTDVEEAARAVARVNGDYEAHRRAARALAEQHLAAGRVLPPLLEAAMD
jgi:hypothetical protein